ncbi:MAG: amidohydrolase family protein [Chloroflexota bacterium]
MIIDFHTHVFPSRLRDNRPLYADRDPSFAALYADAKARLATAEELLARMDGDGVDRAVITNYGWTDPELLKETNDYIREAVVRFPERLVGFCAVPLDSPENAVAEIERCAGPGIKGVGELRLDLASANLPATLPPVIAALRHHGLLLLLHVSEPVGHDYPGKGSATPERLYPLLARFPEQTFICAHWGGGLPFYALMPEVKAGLSNVYFDTAASPFLYQPGIYRAVNDIVGAEKILFGSDYPLLPPSRYFREIQAAALTDAARKLILGENARRLLGI